SRRRLEKEESRELVEMAGVAQAPKRALAPQGRGPRSPPRPRFAPVDREKTCPLLLRVFTKVGSHHTNEDFAVRGKEPKDEVQIYTWKDANLRELTDLVKEVAPAARRRNAKLSFAIVYPDRHGHFVVKELKNQKGKGKKNCADEIFSAISDMPIIKREKCCIMKVGRTLSYGNGRLDDAKVLAELGFAVKMFFLVQYIIYLTDIPRF
ncbi:unnamed protein product, partial [Prunus brigantina]